MKTKMKKWVTTIKWQLDGTARNEKLQALATDENPFAVGEVINIPTGVMYRAAISPMWQLDHHVELKNDTIGKVMNVFIHPGKEAFLWVKMLGEVFAIPVDHLLLKANNKSSAIAHSMSA